MPSKNPTDKTEQLQIILKYCIGSLRWNYLKVLLFAFAVGQNNPLIFQLCVHMQELKRVHAYACVCGKKKPVSDLSQKIEC